MPPWIVRNLRIAPDYAATNELERNYFVLPRSYAASDSPNCDRTGSSSGSIARRRSSRWLLWPGGLLDVCAARRSGKRATHTTHGRTRFSPRALGCNAPRHRWHSQQPWQFRICNLQNLNDGGKFESHSLRHHLKHFKSMSCTTGCSHSRTPAACVIKLRLNSTIVHSTRLRRWCGA